MHEKVHEVYEENKEPSFEDIVKEPPRIPIELHIEDLVDGFICSPHGDVGLVSFSLSHILEAKPFEDDILRISLHVIKLMTTMDVMLAISSMIHIMGKVRILKILDNNFLRIFCHDHSIRLL